MTIFIDADSCPQKVRDIVYRASIKRNIPCIQIANRRIPHPKHITMIITDASEGSADEEILGTAHEGDLVITRDIPLADRLLKNNVTVINDRGGQFSKETIGERLSMRNAMADFRAHGLLEPSQKQFSQKELKAFADCFDATIQKLVKNQSS